MVSCLRATGLEALGFRDLRVEGSGFEGLGVQGLRV